MPEAIATTKRKFYKALDALTNSSTSTVHDPPSSITSNNNTRTTVTSAAAFDEARGRARKRLRQSTSTTSLKSTTADGHASIITLPRKTPGRTRPRSGIVDKTPPHFAPWSQESFLARLKTYSSVSMWHPKPDLISEVEWAKRGWICVEVNTVACRGGCERRVLVSLGITEPGRANADVEDDGDERAAALEEALAKRYKDEIINGHSSSCMWHKAGCKDDIYRLPVVRPSVWQPDLSKRFRSLLGIETSIDKVRTRTLEASSVSEKLLADLPREVIDPSDTKRHSSIKVFAIALHGWRGSVESGNDLLHCDACFQRVGLWMYQPDYTKRSRGADDMEVEEADEASIDLVEMHREHCPWRNPETQKATGTLAGLNASQILHRVVATAARDHRRRSHEPVKAAGSQVQGDVEEEQPPATQTVSRAEIDQQDKVREGKLRKLRSLFNIKRKSTSTLPAQS